MIGAEVLIFVCKQLFTTFSCLVLRSRKAVKQTVGVGPLASVRCNLFWLIYTMSKSKDAQGECHDLIFTFSYLNITIHA